MFDKLHFIKMKNFDFWKDIDEGFERQDTLEEDICKRPIF